MLSLVISRPGNIMKQTSQPTCHEVTREDSRWLSMIRYTKLVQANDPFASGFQNDVYKSTALYWNKGQRKLCAHDLSKLPSTTQFRNLPGVSQTTSQSHCDLPLTLFQPKTYPHFAMHSSGSQHHRVHNRGQTRRRQPASSLQSRFGPGYNSYELLSISPSISDRRSYSESDHGKQASKAHAESSSTTTIKSESPPTDSSHVSRVMLEIQGRRLLS